MPFRHELRGEARLLDEELARLDERLAVIDARRQSLAARLRNPSWKWLRDLLGAGLGIVLAPPSNGISLVLTFWVSCGLLVDGLDLAPEIGELLRSRAEVREVDLRRKAIQARLDEIEIELDDIA